MMDAERTIIDEIEGRSLTFMRHMLSMNANRRPREAFEWQSLGKRKLGRSQS